MQPRILRLAIPFYGAAVLLAAVIGAISGVDPFALGDSPMTDLLLGAATAGCFVAAGLVAYRLLPALRTLADELGPQLVDGARTGDLVLLAVLSGFGEEVLFRGALQPLLGLVLTSLIFGALHVGPDRRYLVWTLWAVVAGFVLGMLYNVTGGILAPATAHALNNAAVLLLWKRSRKGGAAR